jgi:dienelactone hydrolase
MHPIALFAALLPFLPLLLCACAMAPAGGHDIRTEEVHYTAGGASLTGYVAWDASLQGKRPGVLVVHEWWGHNDYVRERARMLAELGYTALALDMYGDGKQAAHPDDAGKFAKEVMDHMDIGVQRFKAALDLLKQQPSTDPAHIAAIGYCFGGGIVLEMARRGVDLDAVASFHGMLGTKTPAKNGQVKAHVLVCHGADDQFVTKDQVAAFKAEMDAAGVHYRFVAYPGAKHGFTSKAADSNGKKFNLPLAYNKAADEQSWHAMQDLFAEVWQ